jgi:serine/threonine-protein kinase
VRHCPVCQKSLEEDARYCPDDGTPLKDIADPYIGAVLLGQFEVREVCGRGSMGTVYRAWQTSMERTVAIKVLRRDLLRDARVVKRFRREAKASAKLSHPSIITVYVVGDTDDGVPFIAMEYVKGRSLSDVLLDEGILRPARAIPIARQIISALAEAHAQRIVHRDLKPENIFLAETSHTRDFVKILDFGIAKILYAHDESMLTQTGAIFGTPHYLAPEQAAGGDVDHRCDLYALGVVLFRMVTGRLPFESESGMAVLIQHLKEEPPRPRDLVPDLPPALEEVILKALSKSPAQRFQTAEAMGEALREVLDRLDTTGPSAPPPPTAPRPNPCLAQTVSDEPDAPAPGAPGAAETDRAAGPPRQEREAAATGASSTLALARNVMGRRRAVQHVLLGAASVLGGSALGAVLYGVKRRSTPEPARAISSATDGPPTRRSDSRAPEARPADAASPPSPPAPAPLRGAPAPESHPRRKVWRRRPAPRRPSAGPSKERPPTLPGTPVSPTGPDPSVLGTDHGSEATPRPAEKPKANDEIYDLVP